MLSLGRNHSWKSSVSTNRVAKSINYKHENTGFGHNFRVPMPSVSLYRILPYFSEIVTYEDDQRAIFHCNFAKTYFAISIIIIFAIIFTSNFYDGVMITPPEQASIEVDYLS